ncbi:DNA ligase (ATP) DNL4 NDAI_0I02260 [Naumovozyma dairenensis CBS 421]|uniref:DNA ligase n=1 Tax=Naumovozyma dairenensis (strain ATCC 10597 / BCRC 20456 / CBS 421 / NBRC 0211 / NRRL Y-12639) TaxID=1071378 RepID=G0WG84_NAUDC|nr:hypothetical protein NDAI_0I02260 [Naumovozyma dairenensis CBS 421]CCD26795.1 hypothetical protein NDAI_0I02260 [Naumovozyma dairenensis CBS 421]
MDGKAVTPTLDNDTRPATPHNFAPSPSFRWLCDELFVKLERIQQASTSKASKEFQKPINVQYYEVIQHFINLWRKTVGNDIYPALILILPYRDRRIYNVRDYTLIKAICSYLKLPKNSFTEKRLLSWKQRAGRSVRLSSFIVSEIKKRKSEPQVGTREEITIDKLNQCLDSLSEERNSKGSMGYRGLSDSPTFVFCLENMTFVELQFFFDIILKSRVIGGHEHKFLNVWHPDAQDYLSVVSDLKTVANKLWDPAVHLKNDDLTINVGSPFAPQSAKKLSISYEKICAKLKHDFFIEEKMDGERIQLHYQDYGNKLSFLSRRGTDYTYLYGESIKDGTVSKYLHLDNNVQNCVLDGEMVTFDKERNALLPFGLVKSSARSIITQEGVANEGYRPLLMVFDLVYLNGVSLVNIPLYQRKLYLEKIFTPERHIVELLRSKRCSDERSIKNALEHAISIGSEGVVLKHYNSRYTVASRNDDWIKVKPEYLEQFGENMDLIVIGKDPGKKDSLMCGLAVVEEDEPEIDEDGNEIVNLDSQDSIGEGEDKEGNEIEREKTIKRFVSFCSIANGISQEEFKYIGRITKGCWKKSDEIPPPSDLLEFGSRVPAEWIDPKDSIVIEVKARSLNNDEEATKKFKTGITLYGGYCRQIREDKDWKTCYTLSELRRMKRFKLGSNKRANNDATHALDSSKRRKARRIDYGFEKYFEQTPTTLDQSRIFDGLYFYVISDVVDATGSRVSREELYDKILNRGGVIVHNVIAKHHGENQFRILCGKYTAECQSLIDRGYDIIEPQWVLDCIKDDMLLKLEPKYCFNVSEELMKIAKRRVDGFGDSFEAQISEDSFSRLIERNVRSLRNAPPSIQYDMVDTVPLFLFYGRTILLRIKDKALFTKLKVQIRLYGGKTTGDLASCNLVVIQQNEIAVAKDVRSSLLKLTSDTDKPPVLPYIVTPEWIDSSISEGCQVPEEDHPVV